MDSASLPDKDITDSDVIVHGTVSGEDWVKVDLSVKRIPVKGGIFISVE